MNYQNYDNRYSDHKIITNYSWPIQIDLHLHTTKSDGNLTPSQLIKLIDRTKLKIISITDHDNISGLEEARKEVDLRENLNLINGIELSTINNKDEIHILGYFIDVNSKKLIEKIKEMKIQRIESSKKIVNFLRKKNIYLSWEEIYSNTNGIIGRPHIARAMIEQNYVKSINEAFEKYLNDENIKNIKKYKMNTLDAINLIQDSGGLAVIAHPKSISNLNTQIEKLVDAGLAGIEVYAEKYEQMTQSYYLKICEKYNLIPTGGTDYHANNQQYEMMPGMNGPPYSTYEKLIEKAKNIHGNNIGQKI
tara:strand:+ start:15906 stop:16823 length:918 start_codon:yes stop_codon:yes gene_type:complete